MDEAGQGYWRLVEPYWEAVSIYDGPDVFLRQFHDIPPASGDLFAAHWCVAEICNGGLYQFFTNSTGVLAPEAIRGIRAIGVTELAAVVQRAVDFFEPPYPRERAVREEILYATQRGTRRRSRIEILSKGSTMSFAG